MKPVNRDGFYSVIRQEFGSLNQGQVNALNFLLTQLEKDRDVEDVRWAAYMLATVKHETAETYMPIEEYGKGEGHSYGEPVTVVDEYGFPHTNAYYGRGLVQLTWADNYQKSSLAMFNDDRLLYYPYRVMEPLIAYAIMSYGMRTGLFTGKSLSDYINDSTCDYYNARRIINGTDRAETLAEYAEVFEKALRA